MPKPTTKRALLNRNLQFSCRRNSPRGQFCLTNVKQTCRYRIATTSSTNTAGQKNCGVKSHKTRTHASDFHLQCVRGPYKTLRHLKDERMPRNWEFDRRCGYERVFGRIAHTPLHRLSSTKIFASFPKCIICICTHFLDLQTIIFG